MERTVQRSRHATEAGRTASGSGSSGSSTPIALPNDAVGVANRSLGALMSGGNVGMAQLQGGGGGPVALSRRGVAGASDATAVARSGIEGPGGDIPHKAQMEQSFGRPFDGVRAHTGPAASAACDALGAHAFASGSDVAFADANPAPSLVAHELTHTLEQGGDVRRKRGDTSRINTGGEATAERVEAHVAAGGAASEVIADVGLGDEEGIQGSFNMGISGFPLSLGVSDAQQLMVRQTVWPLFPRTVLPTPPFCPTPPVWLQLVVQASVQREGGVAAGAEPSGRVGVRLVGDVNLELAGGIPEVLSISGGVGLRGLATMGIEVSEDSWRLDAGTISLNGALIVALNVGPQALIRFEFRIGESELLRLNLLESTSERGLSGMTCELGSAFDDLSAFIEDAHRRVDELVARVTEPVRVMVEAGQRVGDVLSCLGGGAGLAIAEALDTPTYAALYEEQTLFAMLNNASVGRGPQSGEERSAAETVRARLWGLVAGRPRRNVGGSIDPLELIGWAGRMRATPASTYGLAEALEILGHANLRSMNAMNLLWELERASVLSFNGVNPNDAADAIVTPIADAMDQDIAQARSQHLAQCGP